MGAFGSTRWNYHYRRRTVEESLALCARELRQFLRDPAPQQLTWQWSRSGRRLGSIGVEVGGGVSGIQGVQSSREIWLRYEMLNAETAPQVIHDRIGLAAFPMRLGGVRWWFICPRCCRLRASLYLAPGARHFACRSCGRLKYQSQRLDPIRRLESRMRHLVWRASPEWKDWLDFPAVAKRPRMHWKTFSNLYGLWCVADERREAHYDLVFAKLFGRLGG